MVLRGFKASKSNLFLLLRDRGISQPFIKLILTTQKATSPLSKEEGTSKKKVILVASAIAAVFLFNNPKPAQAGLLSFIGDLFKTEVAAEEVIPNNTQKMALLEPIYNPENSSDSGVDLNIASNNTLLADSGPMGTIADINNAGSDEIGVYVVRKGDNLTKIAKMFDVTENTIRWANDIKKGGALKEGQELVILPVSGVQYTVKKGDTLKSIAKKFSGEVDDIIDFNDLAINTSVSEGDIIIIPDGDLIESTPVVPSTKKVKFKKDWSNYPLLNGYFARPMDGGRKTQGIHGFNAVDIADSCGENIYAVASGKVVLSRGSGAYNGGYGNYVVISHPNGVQSLYAHMSKNEVVSGQEVSQGQLIGYVGHTGRTRPTGVRGCHLHLEIRGAQNPF